MERSKDNDTLLAEQLARRRRREQAVADEAVRVAAVHAEAERLLPMRQAAAEADAEKIRDLGRRVADNARDDGVAPTDTCTIPGRIVDAPDPKLFNKNNTKKVKEPDVTFGVWLLTHEKADGEHIGIALAETGELIEYTYSGSQITPFNSLDPMHVDQNIVPAPSGILVPLSAIDVAGERRSMDVDYLERRITQIL